MEITNRGDPSDYPDLAESVIYICTVRWHARASADADLRFMVSLLNTDTKILLQAYEYMIPADTEKFGATTFQINVPIEDQGIVSWRLEVTLTPLVYFQEGELAPADVYDWGVDTTPIPEFSTTMTGLVLFLSVLTYLVLSRKHQTMSKRYVTKRTATSDSKLAL